MNMMVVDQQALSFAIQEGMRINTQVYEAKYPSYDYGRLMFVDTSGPEWSPGVITFTGDRRGAANWQSGYAKDIPLADVTRDMQQKQHFMAAIGYQFNIEEINVARLHNYQLENRRAMSARTAYEEFMYGIAIGNTAAANEKGLRGILNLTGVTAGNFPADGAGGGGGSTLWVNKTPAQIVRDINSLLTGIYTTTLGIELADTVIMPDTLLNYIAGTPYSDTTMETILSFVQRTNVYTIRTGRPLTILGERAAATAGAGSTTRVAAYRNAEDVVKLHLPMPFRFLPIYQDGPLNFTTPGIFRTGGVEALTPQAIRYGDGA